MKVLGNWPAMRFNRKLPVVAAAGRAYALLWEQRALHAKAIWPPIVFLVAAEFLYHRVVGNAEGFSDRWHAVLGAPWYMPAGAVVAWLAGLKFLLSFSISWRRHLLLGEKFDPFFFKAPFWRYLGFLLLTYAWVVPVVLLSLVPAALFAAAHAQLAAEIAAIALGLPTLACVVWGIVRQVPFFTGLTLDPPRPGWRASTGAMRGTVARYVAAFVLAMLPVAALDLLLDFGLTAAGADRHSVPVALGESAFRQAMLFVHFSLGASIGAVTTMLVLPQARERLPDTEAAMLLSRL
jgi:hypothetical protein